MKAMLYHGPKDIRYEDYDLGYLNSGEVLVRVDVALTGGTDLKTYLRGHPKLITSLPSAFGYEYCGTISELGVGVEGFAIGDRVISANTAPCYECYFCAKQEYSLCRDLQFLNGSFSEYIKIPARIVKHNLWKISPELDPKEAAATQTLAVALHGLDKSDIAKDDIVAILGLGAIGQSFIKLAKHRGVQVAALGRSAAKLELARANGADYIVDISQCFDNDELNSEKLTKLWEARFYQEAPYGPDKVIEAVGKLDSWQAALALTRPGGLVNMFGGCAPKHSIAVDCYKLHYEELRVIGVFHHTPVHIKAALDLISSGAISMSNLISHEFPLAKLEEALELQLSGQAMKIAIKP